MKAFRNRVKMTVLALAMVACMVAFVLTGFGMVEAKADQIPVQYAFYNEEAGKFEVGSCDDYVTVSNATDYTMSENRWYVFEGEVTITNRVIVSGTANIILKDGCVFTASEGINVATGNTLNIYGQGSINGENAVIGELICYGMMYQAGIGGENGRAGGNITISGGKITTRSTYGGAGIGGGCGGAGGIITINGGKVEATGGIGGAGIGGGSFEAGGNITINGGEVTATGGNNGAGIGGGAFGAGGIITINGGEITIQGSAQGGAGIGGGDHGAGGNITISGGKITTQGSTYGGAGIGGGFDEAGGSITINGGEVTATGASSGAGIGGGQSGAGGIITINGGKVTATGGDCGAGIGGGQSGAGGSITINGGIVTATGGCDGAGIGGESGGAGGIITINGGKVTATGGDFGAGIGGGSSEAGGIITINGGEVTATGGDCGDGIGGGGYEAGGRITITGGEVTVTGGNNGAGIGNYGTYELNSGMIWFSSANETSEYAGMTGTGTFGATFGANKRYALVYKEHSAFLTSSGNTITAKYIDGSGNKQSINLEIEAPTDGAIIFGVDASAQAKLNGCENFNSALGKTGNEQVSASKIEYYKGNGELLAGGASTAKGRYTAKITVDGVTAAVDYEITKDDPAISVSAATGLAYTGDDLQLITAGSTSGGTLKYRLSENALFDIGIPTGENAGNYTVYYKVEGNNEYKSSKVYSIDVEIKKANLNLSLTQSGWVKGEQSVSPVLGGNAGNGTVTYAYKKQSDDDNTYSGSVPTEAGNYIIKATVAETANYFGTATTAAFTISEPVAPEPDPEPDPDPEPEPEPTPVTPPAIVISTPVYYPEPVVEKKEEPKPSIFTRENKDGSVTTIEIIWNADGTTTVINEIKQADGAVERKEETRDSKGNGTLKIEKKDASGNLLSSTEGTIAVNKKGTETIKSTTLNSDGSKEEKTQKTYKRDPAADNVKKVTINVKKTDATGNTEVVKTTAFVGVLGDATVTEKSEYTFAAGNNGAENGAAGGASNPDKGEEGSGGKNKSDKDKADGNSTTKVVKEERQYSLSVNGRVKLLVLTSDGERVTIPESIELDGMKRVVKSIGKNALKGNKTVKSVEIGENITTICSGAFKNCKNLELIELTGSIKTIYKNAFKGIAKNAKFVIKASEEDFARIVELVKKSGVDDSVTFERAE